MDTCAEQRVQILHIIVFIDGTLILLSLNFINPFSHLPAYIDSSAIKNGAEEAVAWISALALLNDLRGFSGDQHGL